MRIFFKYKIHLFLLFSTSLLIYYLFPNYIYKYLVPVIIKNNQFFLFADWSVIISAINCKDLGFNVFIENPCDFNERRHVYGSALLFIPFIKEYSKIYLLYFPIIINIFFIIIVVLHFKFLKLKELFLVIFFIFNPSTLLAMERLNIDLLILMTVIFISYSSSNYIKLFLIPLLASIKFYPAVLFQLFFLNKNKDLKKSIYFFIISIAILAFIIFLDKKNIIQVFNNSLQYSAGGRYLFSFFSIPDYLNINYKFFIIFMGIIFLLYTYFIFNYLKENISALVDIDKKEIDYYTSLLIAGGGILCVTFFIFKNVYYREIFLFCVLPYVVHQSYRYKIFEYFINFMIFRYIFFLFSNGFSISLGNQSLIVYKFIFDLLVVGFLSAIIIFEYRYIYLSFYKKNK